MKLWIVNSETSVKIFIKISQKLTEQKIPEIQKICIVLETNGRHGEKHRTAFLRKNLQTSAIDEESTIIFDKTLITPVSTHINTREQKPPKL